MHYYKHHIGDFIKDTSRLTDSQTMTYLRLLWLYYESEKPLPLDAATLAFKTGSDEPTVTMILSAFFKRSDNGWLQIRCESEIRQYQMKAESARGANRARWSDTNMKSDVKSDKKSDPNQEPITKNHKPITNIKPIPAANAASVDGFAEFWQAYPKKTGKAAAMKAWAKLKPKPLEACLAALSWQRHSEQWTKDGGQYVPNPSTYLAQGRWMDEPIQIKTKPKEKSYHEQLRETSDALCGRNRRDGETVIDGTATRVD